MAAGGSPHFKLYPSEYYKLLEQPRVSSASPEASLHPQLVSRPPVGSYFLPELFDKTAYGVIPKTDLKLRTYLKHEKDLLSMTDAERTAFMETMKPMTAEFAPLFNEYVLSSEEITDFAKDPTDRKSNLSYQALADVSIPSVAIPLFISKTKFKKPTDNHVITIMRRGRDFEIYDPSAFDPSEYTDDFRMAFTSFMKKLTKATGGVITHNSIPSNPYGFCDTIACVRSYYKDTPGYEFNKLFVSPVQDISHSTLLKEYIKLELPKQILSTAIKTMEEPAARHATRLMEEEDVMSSRMRAAFKREQEKEARLRERYGQKPKFKVSDLFK
jgi:hypothetical protein